MAAAASPAAAGVAGGSLIASARWICSCASRRCPVSSQNRCSAATDRQAHSASPAVMLWASAARRFGCSAVSRPSQARWSTVRSCWSARSASAARPRAGHPPDLRRCPDHAGIGGRLHRRNLRIGGGSILSPVLIASGRPPTEAAPAALASTLVTSAAGVATFAILSIHQHGSVAPNWPTGIALGIGGLTGAYTGARLQPRSPIL